MGGGVGSETVSSEVVAVEAAEGLESVDGGFFFELSDAQSGAGVEGADMGVVVGDDFGGASDEFDGDAGVGWDDGEAGEVHGVGEGESESGEEGSSGDALEVAGGAEGGGDDEAVGDDLRSEEVSVEPDAVADGAGDLLSGDDDVVDAAESGAVLEFDGEFRELGDVEFATEELFEDGEVGVGGALGVLAEVSEGAFGDAGEALFGAEEGAVPAVGDDEVGVFVDDVGGEEPEHGEEVIEVASGDGDPESGVGEQRVHGG